METIQVKVGQVPGRIQEIAIAKGSTIKSILELAGLAIDPSYSITVNGNPAGLEDTVSTSNVSILLTRKIRGA